MILLSPGVQLSKPVHENFFIQCMLEIEMRNLDKKSRISLFLLILVVRGMKTMSTFYLKKTYCPILGIEPKPGEM